MLKAKVVLEEDDGSTVEIQNYCAMIDLQNDMSLSLRSEENQVIAGFGPEAWTWFAVRKV